MASQRPASFGASSGLLEHGSFRDRRHDEGADDAATGRPMGVLSPPVRLESLRLRRAWDWYFSLDTSPENDTERLAALKKVKSALRRNSRRGII